MKFVLRGRLDKRVRNFTFISGSHETAVASAIHLLVNHLRLQKGYTGEVWKFGKIELQDSRGNDMEIIVPPHLEIVSSNTLG